MEMTQDPPLCRWTSPVCCWGPLCIWWTGNLTVVWLLWFKLSSFSIRHTVTMPHILWSVEKSKNILSKCYWCSPGGQGICAECRWLPLPHQRLVDMQSVGSPALCSPGGGRDWVQSLPWSLSGKRSRPEVVWLPGMHSLCYKDNTKGFL